MKKKIKLVPNFQSERGQSLVEFAFGLVILFILLAGVADLGRALFTYMSLRDAAQEGALYGSTNPTAQTSIKDRVLHSSDLVQSMLTAGDVQIDVLGSACSGHAIRVRVELDHFQLTMPFIGALVGRQSFPISATVTDTILSPSCH